MAKKYPLEIAAKALRRRYMEAVAAGPDSTITLTQEDAFLLLKALHRYQARRLKKPALRPTPITVDEARTIVEAESAVLEAPPPDAAPLDVPSPPEPPILLPEAPISQSDQPPPIL